MKGERGQARRRLHEGLVGERALVGAPYLADPELRAAYVEELAPRTIAALGRVFAGAGFTSVRRALDLGAGTGAAGEAVRARFGAVEIVAVDRVAAPGVRVADLARAGRPAGVEGRFELVVAAHLLNELPLTSAEKAERVAFWCHELLAPAGSCVIVEPALRETSRALLEVRDRLVARGLHVAAPCFWQGPCPALARERDWCHDAAPPVAADRSRVDFSYLVLRREGEAATDPALYRVVSDRLEEKGRQRLYGCGPAGRHPLVRLTRERSVANEAFEALERGDVVRVTGAQHAGDGLRIERDSAVLRESNRG
ncbi:MAG TPA: small ribosomal subunit Rsm22 family protein [Polyangia bacterium]|nr:small ribosomal subunit Rsm22 family protein [Polyangia bacterium]